MYKNTVMCIYEVGMLVNFEFRHNFEVINKGTVSVDFEEEKRQFDLRLKHSSVMEIYLANKQAIVDFNNDMSYELLIPQLVIPSLIGNASWSGYIENLREPLVSVNLTIEYLTFSGYKAPIYRLSVNEFIPERMIYDLCNSYFDDISVENGLDVVRDEYARSFILKVTYSEGVSENNLSRTVNMENIEIGSIGVFSLNNQLMAQILETTNVSDVIKDNDAVITSLHRFVCDEESSINNVAVVAGFYAYDKCLNEYGVNDPGFIHITLTKDDDNFGIEVSVE